MGNILAIIKITGLRVVEVRHMRDAIYFSNVTCDRRVLNDSEESGEVSFAMIIDDYDYAENYVDNWVRAELQEIVARFRACYRVDRDNVPPFERRFTFAIPPEDSIPIDYTVEYRADYGKDYIPDDISEWLKSKGYGLRNRKCDIYDEPI